MPIKPFLFLVFALFGLSFIKPGLLKQIARVEFVYKANDIMPGNLVEISLKTVLKDSSEIFSTESNTTINFADYVFVLEKGAVIHDKTRTSLTLKIADDAYEDPQVVFSVKLRRKGSINATVVAPILYDGIQAVYFSGKNGYDPRANSNDGFRKIPIAGRVNIEFIDNSQTLTNNSDPNIVGGKAPDLDVYVSKFKTINGTGYLKIVIRKDLGGEYTKYLRVGLGLLEIYSVGGKGGISKYGGKGGDGGDVTVFITNQARPYFDQIFIVNHGGDGGDLWRPQVDGQQQGPFGNDGAIKLVDWNEE